MSLPDNFLSARQLYFILSLSLTSFLASEYNVVSIYLALECGLLRCHSSKDLTLIHPIWSSHLVTSQVNYPAISVPQSQEGLLGLQQNKESLLLFQGHCKSCTMSNILNHLWRHARWPGDVSSLPQNYSRTWKCINTFPSCFVFGFVCLVKHIRRIGYRKKSCPFYLVNPSALLVDIISNGSQITFL